jgi:hypothetical protein
MRQPVRDLVSLNVHPLEETRSNSSLLVYAQRDFTPKYRVATVLNVGPLVPDNIFTEGDQVLITSQIMANPGYNVIKDEMMFIPYAEIIGNVDSTTKINLYE